ncbi:MAG TPA: hypothetical protein VGS21_09965 [Acidimicrobiales bacterium]|nr:hypothetical protein [Acidimicrobiales bacterium]
MTNMRSTMLRRAILGAIALAIPVMATSATVASAATVSHSTGAPASVPRYNTSVWKSINELTGFQPVNVSVGALQNGGVAGGICPSSNGGIGSGKNCTGTICWSNSIAYGHAGSGQVCMWVLKSVVALSNDLGALGLDYETGFPDALSMICAHGEYVNNPGEHGTFTSEQGCLEALAGPSMSYGIFTGSGNSNTMNYWFAKEATSYVPTWYCSLTAFVEGYDDPFTGVVSPDDAKLAEMWAVSRDIIGLSENANGTSSCAS